jgi:hypothetical protein
MDIQGLTPPPGKLKSVWISGADGRLECIWVPDWEREYEAGGRPAGSAAA